MAGQDSQPGLLNPHARITHGVPTTPAPTVLGSQLPWDSSSHWLTTLSIPGELGRGLLRATPPTPDVSICSVSP